MKTPRILLVVTWLLSVAAGLTVCAAQAGAVFEAEESETTWVSRGSDPVVLNYDESVNVVVSPTGESAGSGVQDVGLWGDAASATRPLATTHDSFGSFVAPSGPARFIDAGGTIIDRSSIRSTISSQRQGRHVLGDRNYNGGSYFGSADDAQRVLDDFHSGSAEILGIKGNDIVVRTNSVTGFNHNPGADFPNQPTNVFFIKGSSKPSVVRYNPTWGA